MPPAAISVAPGRFAYHFARGKLGGDPVFLALLERGLLSDRARILDLGCGQGLLAAWLLAARRQFESGELLAAGPNRVGLATSAASICWPVTFDGLLPRCRLRRVSNKATCVLSISLRPMWW